MDWLEWALLCASALLSLFVFAWLSIVKIDPRKPSCVVHFQSTRAQQSGQSHGKDKRLCLSRSLDFFFCTDFTLPNGLGVWGFSPFDIFAVFYEMFEEAQYFKHGITLNDSSVVLDIGANTGIFAVYLAQRYPAVKVHCFEPVPDTFQLLQLNATKYNKSAALHNVGLSSTETTASFHFDQSLSVGAGAYQDSIWNPGKKAGVMAWIRASLHDLALVHLIPRPIASALLAILSIPVVAQLFLLAISPFGILYVVFLSIRSLMSTKQVKVSLTTLSAFLKQESVSRVSLAKIDVEGAELEVLRGIQPLDFKKFDQFVIEVHDINDRVKTICSLLESHGFQTIVEQEDWHSHRLLSIFTVFARRA